MTAADARQRVSSAPVPRRTATEAAGRGPGDRDAIAPEALTWEVTTWEDPRAAGLRAAMDSEIAPRYEDLRRGAPPPVPPTDQDVAAVLLVLAGGAAVATGALRRLPDRWEVKRLFIDRGHRRRGLAGRILDRLESEARDRGARALYLQTGFRQPEAIALYERHGWRQAEVYPPYDPADGISVCFRKDLGAR
ncbi:GNAT family N-acetyltransferase [Brachybacterium hainanense]|uniref:GNAT family N-acetyltransferase n=1 Tax=Brachybacterium hainanense TaxID=1541174 RepID=A0ABV6R9Y8_9MICO